MDHKQEFEKHAKAMKIAWDNYKLYEAKQNSRLMRLCLVSVASHRTCANFHGRELYKEKQKNEIHST